MAQRLIVRNYPVTKLDIEIAEKVELAMLHAPFMNQATFRVSQLIWKTNAPWPEANLWAVMRARESPFDEAHLKTCANEMKNLKYFMDYLEYFSLNWWHLPKTRSDRCIFKYLEHLKSRTKEKKIPVGAQNGKLKTSTAALRVGIVRRFYSWLKEQNLLSPNHNLWETKIAYRTAIDSIGREYVTPVATSDFMIEIRTRDTHRLEDGVFPVSEETRTRIINLARRKCPLEIHLMLELSFFSGMRLGSICDLRIETLESASEDPVFKGFSYISIGPNARPVPVATKFGVNGSIILPTSLLLRLKDYISSPRRLTREAKASAWDKNLVFLNKNGCTYDAHNENDSSSMNVAMHRLRTHAALEDINISDFNFHRCRATFATSIALAAIEYRGSKGLKNVVALIRNLLLHKDDETAMGYINFIEDSKIISDQSNEYTRKFLGHRITEHDD